ncbi:CoA pyrophosphatase [Sandarakinorhabdus sp.]|uniref:CoA pyrophosphatase n=1 Tax=Sandarakinorhabdus sp. TaxID=1916663 RepID=UPI00286E6463|nr:CoA pyrophosphatase [Sandarakinorhabdus sp.]
MHVSALRAALAAAGPPGQGGDWDLMANPAPATTALTPAAVLIAVTNEAQPQLLLTRRTAHLKAHAGQVAFPGGRVDAGDADPVAAALREADEEVALDPALVEVLGTSDHYRTGSGYLITPVIGVVPPGIVYRPHPGEVAEIFHVPFAHALNPAHHERHSGMWQGETRHYYIIRHEGRAIWGATAGMLVTLSRRLGL